MGHHNVFQTGRPKTDFDVIAVMHKVAQKATRTWQYKSVREGLKYVFEIVYNVRLSQ